MAVILKLALLLMVLTGPSSSRHRNTNCGKTGYYYQPISLNHGRQYPNCVDGLWIPCGICPKLGLCQLKACTMTADTVCGSCQHKVESVMTHVISNPNCKRVGYFYIRVSERESPELNCHEGMWFPCRDCAIEGLREHRPCRPTEDATCVPESSHHKDCLSDIEPVRKSASEPKDESQTSSGKDVAPLALTLVFIFAVLISLFRAIVYGLCSQYFHRSCRDRDNKGCIG